MSPEDVLPTIAEMAITLAGFSGLIVSVRPGRLEAWSPDQMLRVVGVISACLMTVFCSVLPFALADLSSSESVRWAVPLLLGGGYYALVVVLIVRAVVTGTLRMIAPWVIWPGAIVMLALSMLSLLSGTGLVVPFSPGLLVLLLTWSLLIAAVTLVVAVVRAFIADAAEG